MDNRQRVVVTGLGVVASNAVGWRNYAEALRRGVSGIRHWEHLRELNFACQVGGIPQGIDELKTQILTQERLLAMNSAMVYAAIAAWECWRDAGLPPVSDEVDWNTGAVVGTGVSGADTLCEIVGPNVSAGNVRRLGSTVIERAMASSVSACVGGLLGLGGRVTTNSSACSTGTEAILDAYFQIREGRAVRVLAGGAEGSSAYVWAGFDSMRVLARGFNDTPERASRPMSATSSGFVPSAGAGVVMLESLESALERGASIWGEIIGGAINSGGQRGEGSMTAPNPEGVRRCIRSALVDARIEPARIDAINGHLTGTMADRREFENWRAALGTTSERFPWINATKSLVGHALGAAGGLECVAGVLQLAGGFVHPSVNCEDLHPDIQPYAHRIPRTAVEAQIDVLAKASFGFGDVNACIFLKKWNGKERRTL